MKKFLLATFIFGGFLSAAFAQGFVFFATGPSLATRISTNSYPGGPATGQTGNTPGIYYYALFASQANDSINGNTNAVSGYSPYYVFENPSGWTLVGTGTNPATFGRIVPMSQGTTAANQGPLNWDTSCTVQGIGGGQFAHFVVVGWSAPGVGTNIDQLAAAYYGGGYAGWIGQSAISGPIQLGNGMEVPTSPVFSGTGPPFLQGFVLGLMFMTERPVIYQQPMSANVIVGSSVTLDVVALGDPTLSYTWYKDSTAISYGTLPSYSITAASTNDAGGYWVVIANMYGSATSTVATVSVGIPPAISQQPASQTVVAGTDATLSVVASGTPPISYQWYGRDGAIAGATNSALPFHPAQTNNWDEYNVVGANSFGSVTSSPAILTVYQPVTILQQPSDQVASNHGSAFFEILATGFPALTYQWSFNGTNLPGATNSLLTISPVVVPSLGNYSVAVDNGFSATNSLDASLYMSPSIVRPFKGTVGTWGQSAILHIGVVGSAPIYYQWFFNGTAVPGATNADYLLPAIQFTNAGLYSVVVGSAYGTVTNATCQVVVNPAEVSLAMRPSLTISGAVGYSYVIQGAFDLADTGSWTTLTNLILTQPVEIWHDDGASPTAPVNATRYYRVLPGQ